MPTLLVHALVASAVQGLVCMSVFDQGINETVFAAAATATIIDLDHRSDGERSPAVHSLFSVLLGSLVLAMSFGVLLGDRAITFAISVYIGLTTHVILDMTDSNGIFIVPWRTRRIAVSCRRRKIRFAKKQRKNLIYAILSGSVLLVLICL